MNVKTIVTVLIAALPAYFLSKVFTGYFPVNNDIVKYPVFWGWWLFLTGAFSLSLRRFPTTKELTLTKVILLIVTIPFAVNVSNFVPYIIPDENVTGIFRKVYVTTGVLIPYEAKQEVFGMVCFLTFVICVGGLFRVAEGLYNKVQAARLKQRGSL